MDLMLKGKVALVTGAGSQVGFGRAAILSPPILILPEFNKQPPMSRNWDVRL